VFRTFTYVSPTDLVPLGGAALTTLAATFLASYLPSRRATRIDPVIALRMIERKKALRNT